MTTTAIIPARGGSKGVPRKNVLPLASKPLLAHTIEHARQAESVDRVCVSTDDPEIAAVSQQYGAQVIWRPTEISGDTASSEAALLHALEYLHRQEGYEPDLLVFLQCTSPLTLPEDIDGTVAALLAEEADSALAVAPFSHFLWRHGGEGAEGINHDPRVRLRRQEWEAQYLETGAVYAMRTAGFKAARHRFFGKTALYVMPRERCLEIDDPVDFRIAEVLLREQQRQWQVRALPHPTAAIVFDFDGVFTDNRVWVFSDGTEAVACNRSDGLGLAQLKRLGIPLLVLSTEQNPVVQARCRKLGLECLSGIEDKRTALREWLAARSIDRTHVVYVGNDINDLEVMGDVGCPIAVANAYPSVLASARLVLSERGGHGAIRELAELIAERGE